MLSKKWHSETLRREVSHGQRRRRCKKLLMLRERHGCQRMKFVLCPNVPDAQIIALAGDDVEAVQSHGL